MPGMRFLQPDMGRELDVDHQAATGVPRRHQRIRLYGAGGATNARIFHGQEHQEHRRAPWTGLRPHEAAGTHAHGPR